MFSTTPFHRDRVPAFAGMTTTTVAGFNGGTGP
jgi:hypothetical protein